MTKKCICHRLGVAMMCGVGEKCNELLADIFNQGNMKFIWPHFPSVTMSSSRADKADEVQLSSRKLNYVYQWKKLLLNVSDLIQRLFLFPLFFFFLRTKEKRLSKAKVNNKKDCLRLSQVTGLIDWFGKHRLEIGRATDMKCLHLCGLSCIQRFSSSQKQTWLMQDFFRFNLSDDLAPNQQ